MGMENDGGEVVDSRVVTLRYEENIYDIIYENLIGTDFEGKEVSAVISDWVSKYTYGVVTPLPQKVTRTDARFLGWHYRSDFADDAVTEISALSTGEVTLYAKFIPCAQITMIATLDSTPVVIEYIGDEVKLYTPSAFSGCAFLGWSRNQVGKEDLISILPTTGVATENFTLYGKWTVVIPRLTVTSTWNNAVDYLSRAYVEMTMNRGKRYEKTMRNCTSITEAVAIFKLMWESVMTEVFPVSTESVTFGEGVSSSYAQAWNTFVDFLRE